MPDRQQAQSSPDATTSQPVLTRDVLAPTLVTGFNDDAVVHK